MNPKAVLGQISIALIAGLSLVGCAAAMPQVAPPPSAAYRGDAPVVPLGKPMNGLPETAAHTNDGSQLSDLKRMVIQIASIDLVVKDVDQQMPRVITLASELGGFVQSSSISKVPDGSVAQLTLKIPSERLDKALVALRSMGEVREEKMSGQDVTTEYSDAGTQIKNLEAAETQLRAIMAKTEKQEDVLKVFNELTRVRGEIEKLKGRMLLLSQSSDLATINITLTPPALPARPKPLGSTWNVGEELNLAFDSLKHGMQGIATLAIRLVVVVLPQVLVVLIPLVIGFKLLLLLLHWLLPKGKPAA